MHSAAWSNPLASRRSVQLPFATIWIFTGRFWKANRKVGVERFILRNDGRSRLHLQMQTNGGYRMTFKVFHITGWECRWEFKHLIRKSISLIFTQAVVSSEGKCKHNTLKHVDVLRSSAGSHMHLSFCGYPSTGLVSKRYAITTRRCWLESVGCGFSSRTVPLPSDWQAAN